VDSLTVAVGLGRATHDVRSESLALAVLSTAQYFRGAHDAAREAADRAVALAPDSLAMGINLGRRGWLHLEHGDYQAAVRDLEPAATTDERPGVDAVLCRSVALLADAQQRAGDREAAIATAQRAIAHAARLRVPWIEGWALRVLGRVAQADGDPAAAVDRLRAAVSLFASAGARFEVARTQLALAEVVHARGDAVEAVRLIAEACAAFRDLRVSAWAARAQELAARLGLSLATNGC